jgi:hypothetical protein
MTKSKRKLRKTHVRYEDVKIMDTCQYCRRDGEILHRDTTCHCGACSGEPIKAWCCAYCAEIGINRDRDDGHRT